MLIGKQLLTFQRALLPSSPQLELKMFNACSTTLQNMKRKMYDRYYHKKKTPTKNLLPFR